jgi:response regulator RpfG family c-di-GMP phosphodiesterase
MDIHLPMFQPGPDPIKMTLGCPRGRPFRPQWRDRLLAAGQDTVYVPREQAGELGDYLRDLADQVLTDPHKPLRMRQLLCRELATHNLRGLFCGDLRPKSLEKAVAGFQSLLERVTEDRSILSSLIEILRSDYNVYTHSVNVSMLAMAFGRFLGLPESRVLTLGMAGMLHDIGQARLPHGLCHKAGPLSEMEWVLMRGHPAEGHKMLSHVPSVSLDVLKMVLHHHENADGGGYPQGLKAKATPLGARLLRVVDAFDAMTSHRPHRPAMQAFEAASAILAQSQDIFGEDLGPRLVRFLASPFMGR